MDRDSLTVLPKSRPACTEDTIVAIATPYGESGIGIIRVSGSLSEFVSNKLFRPRQSDSQIRSHHMVYGEIVDPDGGRPVDEALMVLMKSPKSYTREDVVEFHCHGGYLVLQKVLELVLEAGARLARPGEFTKRAFLNGRIDLTQAEAVADLIRAKTRKGLEIANQQLRGQIYQRLSDLKEKLISRLALLEAHIDFPEEEIDAISKSSLLEEMRKMAEDVGQWLSTYEEGRLFREGISCAIVGKANVGKSSLLNLLLQKDRAIVTPIPGTTRDVIEDVLNIREIPVRLIDTAGLRKTHDLIEMEGVRRTRERLAESDFVLLVIDASRVLDGEDLQIIKETEGKERVIVANKSDLPLFASKEEMEKQFPEDPVVLTSALTGAGMEDLKDAIYHKLIHRDISASAEYVIVANIRHRDALSRTKESLSRVQKGLEENLSLEFIAFEIRSALDEIGEIIGETTTEEVLDRIFSQFCIGK